MTDLKEMVISVLDEMIQKVPKHMKQLQRYRVEEYNRQQNIRFGGWVGDFEEPYSAIKAALSGIDVNQLVDNRNPEKKPDEQTAINIINELLRGTRGTPVRSNEPTWYD